MGEDIEQTRHLFDERMIEPHPAIWKQWGMREDTSPDQVRAELQARGFTGLSWNTMRSRAFADPLELCKRLSIGGLIYSVRLVAEAKHAPEGFDSVADKLLASPAAARETLEGQMLAVITGDWKWQPPHAGQTRPIILDYPAHATKGGGLSQGRALVHIVRTITGS